MHLSIYKISKNLWLLFAIVIFLTASGGGVAYYYKTHTKTGTPTQETEKVTWVEHTFRRYGHNFSIRLPEPVVRVAPGISDEGYPLFPGGISSVGSGLLTLESGTVSFFVKNSDEPLDQWVQSGKGRTSPSDQLIKTSIGGLPAVRTHIASQMQEYEEAFIQNGNIIYNIEIGDHVNFSRWKPYADEIINSFNIVPEERSSEPVDTSSWERHYEPKLALSFLYPANWTMAGGGTQADMYEIGIFPMKDTAWSSKMYLSSEFDSYEKLKHLTFNDKERPWLLGDKSSQATFAGLPAEVVYMNMGNKRVGQCLFTSNQIFQPFGLCFDHNDPIQKAIVESIDIMDVESSRIVKSLQEPHLFVAQKERTTVTVNKLDIIKNTSQKIFSYQEGREAATDGNTWNGLPPNIALSHDKKKIAYTSEDGLYVYDLLAKKSSALITKKSEPPPNTEQAPSWSESSFTRVYNLNTPKWSFDDKYISFSLGLYEGTDVRIINVASKNVSDSASSSLEFAWSPTEQKFAAAGGGGYSEAGLFIGTAADPKKTTNFSSTFVKKGEDNPFFRTVDFSADGKLLLTTWAKTEEDVRKMSVFDIDKQTSSEVGELKKIQRPFFGEDNSHIYFLSESESDASVLVRFNIKTKKREGEIKLPVGFDRWEKVSVTPEGYLAIWASVSTEGAYGSNTNRLYLVDPKTSSIIYTSELYKTFTSFLGFSR